MKKLAGFLLLLVGVGFDACTEEDDNFKTLSVPEAEPYAKILTDSGIYKLDKYFVVENNDGYLDTIDIIASLSPCAKNTTFRLLPSGKATVFPGPGCDATLDPFYDMDWQFTHGQKWVRLYNAPASIMGFAEVQGRYESKILPNLSLEYPGIHGGKDVTFVRIYHKL